MAFFIQSLKKALGDFRSNTFINMVTIVVIALSILMLSVILMLFDNAVHIMENWAGDNRAMVYMKSDIAEEDLPIIKKQILDIIGVKEIKCISNTQAMKDLAKKFPGHEGIFNSFKKNPLPHALEVRFDSKNNPEKIKELKNIIDKIKTFDSVESIVYAQGFLKRLSLGFSMIQRTGYVLCSLFSLICIFITANTVRLSLYSRELEVQVLRLVGATEHFIKSPFYLAGALQGFLGGLLGIGILWGLYNGLCMGCSESFGDYIAFSFHFLSVFHITMLLVGSTFLGWFGCYLSLFRMGQ